MNNNLDTSEVEKRIYLIRNKRVMLDHDLAELYRVRTKVLNQAIKRNKKRFPEDFIFQLNEIEKKEVVTNCDHLSKLKFSKNMPYAFTEQGVAMLSSVLNSDRAIHVNIQIMRTFVRVRELATAHQDLWLKIDEMEKKYDKQFQVIFKAIKFMLERPIDGPKKRF